MRQHVEVSGVHPNGSADKAFSILRELDKHVQPGGVIQSLAVEPLSDGARISHWETKFRAGILRWSQRDEFDDDTHTMRFELCEGDAETLEGTWRIDDAEGGCRITFACEFDLGIPSLSEFLDPVAVRVLRETVVAQLTDIFGADFAVDEAGASFAQH
jgi:ribosome-associated toxin RatA of RatAB toxin-antitoxin module